MVQFILISRVKPQISPALSIRDPRLSSAVAISSVISPKQVSFPITQSAFPGPQYVPRELDKVVFELSPLQDRLQLCSRELCPLDLKEQQ